MVAYPDGGTPPPFTPQGTTTSIATSHSSPTTFALTGGDVTGLVLIGIAAVAVGSALTRHTRRYRHVG
jgi:hypothetical protein